MKQRSFTRPYGCSVLAGKVIGLLAAEQSQFGHQGQCLRSRVRQACGPPTLIFWGQPEEEIWLGLVKSG